MKKRIGQVGAKAPKSKRQTQSETRARASAARAPEDLPLAVVLGADALATATEAAGLAGVSLPRCAIGAVAARVREEATPVPAPARQLTGFPSPFDLEDYYSKARGLIGILGRALASFDSEAEGTGADLIRGDIEDSLENSFNVMFAAWRAWRQESNRNESEAWPPELRSAVVKMLEDLQAAAALAQAMALALDDRTGTGGGRRRGFFDQLGKLAPRLLLEGLPMELMASLERRAA